MKKYILAASAVLVVFFISTALTTSSSSRSIKKVVVPAATIAPPPILPAPVNPPTSAHISQYNHDYYEVRQQDGFRAPGRNIVKWGFAPGQGVTDAQVMASDATLQSILAPPSAQPAPDNVANAAPAINSTNSSVPQSSDTSGASSGGWAISSSIVQCESGGQNLPPNSAGAAGYYQIIPSTWQANGGSTASADQASLAEQSAVASKIMATDGPNAWVCK